MTLADAPPTLITRLERPPVPDADKLMITPLDMLVEVMTASITPAIRRQFEAQFGAHLGKGQHPALINRQALEFLCRHCLPEYSLADAYREFGRRSVLHYRASILGRIMMAAVPLMGIERLLRQYPRQLAAVTNYGTRTVYALAPGEWRLDAEDEGLLPEQLQGNLESACGLVHPQDLRVGLVIHAPGNYSFPIHWQP